MMVVFIAIGKHGNLDSRIVAVDQELGCLF